MQVTVNHPPNPPEVLETVLSQVKYWKLAVIRPSAEISPHHVAIMWQSSYQIGNEDSGD